MLCPTNLKQRSKKPSKAKEQKNTINVIENSDNSNNASYDEAVENNDGMAAKETPTLHTFWNQKKSVEEADELELNDNEEQLEKVDVNDDIGGPSENEIEIRNWYKKIPTALDDLVVNHTIPIFEVCFLGCQALFAFDNTTSHAAFSHDALITKYMNLNMVFPSDYCILELRGEAKGLKKVLRERGLWPEKELRLKEAQELM
ncbi:46483_t:CDS:2, partial [Gigaspora margarita]